MSRWGSCWTGMTLLPFEGPNFPLTSRYHPSGLLGKRGEGGSGSRAVVASPSCWVSFVKGCPADLAQTFFMMDVPWGPHSRDEKWGCQSPFYPWPHGGDERQYPHGLLPGHPSISEVGAIPHPMQSSSPAIPAQHSPGKGLEKTLPVTAASPTLSGAILQGGRLWGGRGRHHRHRAQLWTLLCLFWAPPLPASGSPARSLCRTPPGVTHSFPVSLNCGLPWQC